MGKSLKTLMKKDDPLFQVVVNSMINDIEYFLLLDAKKKGY